MVLPIDITSFSSAKGAVDGVGICLQDSGEAEFEISDIKGGEKPQGSHCKRSHRGERLVLGEQRGKVKHSAIATQRYAEVYICRVKPLCAT